MKTRVFTILFVTLCASQVCAGDGNRRYTNAFLEIPLGARPAGMGAAYAAIAEDGTAFFWNPAGIAFVNKRQVSFMYSNQFDGLADYHFIGYTHQLTDQYGFSVAWIRYSVGNIAETSPLGGSFIDRGSPGYDFSQYFHGRFDYTDNAIFFSFARMNSFKANLGWAYDDLPIQIPVGVNFKIINGGTSGISGNNGVVTKDVKKTGIGVDLATLIRFSVADFAETPGLGDFAIGFNLQDLTSTAVRYNAISSDVRAQDVTKPNLKFGMAYIHPITSLQSNIVFAYENNSRYNNDRHYGLEWNYRRTAAIRLGADNGRVTYGAGFSLWKMQFDYALLNHTLGNVHRISMAYKF